MEAAVAVGLPVTVWLGARGGCCRMSSWLACAELPHDLMLSPSPEVAQEFCRGQCNRLRPFLGHFWGRFSGLFALWN